MSRSRLAVAATASLVVIAAIALAVTRWGGNDDATTALARESGSRMAVISPTTTTLSSATTFVPTTTTTTTTTTSTTTTTVATTASTAAPATAAPETSALATSPSTTAPSTTAPSTTTTSTPPPPPSTTTTAPRSQPGPGPAPYRGLGTWVDAYDFSPAHRNDGNPSVAPADVDHMASLGIETLYLQAARANDPKAPGDLMQPDLLGQFLLRAHANGMKVVAWFLPHHADVDDDMRHLQAMLDFEVQGHRFDSIALDIEWRNGEADHGLRSARLVEVSKRLRAGSPDRPVGAIVMPPVVTDVLNTSFWPGYPWAELAPLFDVFMPMSYWTNRAGGSHYRNAYNYTAENIALLRQHVGNVAVHPIGGIGNAATHADYDDFMRAAVEAGSAGWSIYDYATTAGDAWPHLR